VCVCACVCEGRGEPIGFPCARCEERSARAPTVALRRRPLAAASVGACCGCRRNPADGGGVDAAEAANRRCWGTEGLLRRWKHIFHNHATVAGTRLEWRSPNQAGSIQ
jgi:hypothetical protein